jgi:hypothetical protein
MFDVQIIRCSSALTSLSHVTLGLSLVFNTAYNLYHFQTTPPGCTHDIDIEVCRGAQQVTYCNFLYYQRCQLAP